MAGSSKQTLKLNLKIWRQEGPNEKGHFMEHKAEDISPDMSFLEMIDVVNQQLIKKGERPIEFDHDCREGICGMCSMVINGNPHGPEKATTTCQLHMRKFKDGDSIVIEPFRAKAFPVVRDLVVDRSSFDRVIESGGYISVNTGNAQDANTLPVRKENADLAFEAATCIGCGACVAACKNASASLFVSAKLAHLNLLPQGQVEAEDRVLNMVAQMDEEGFGACTNTGACSAACPKEIKLENIAKMNSSYAKAKMKSRS
ncbi:MAG: succinate dehydrogenase/fumarate reductase iron-sulfur subunit [Bdellovibrionales bacterium]|nr:succinate dehydrogenase/fumarate reductase iron-sulfur subunit [Bdellovibrionales bacterium]